MTATKRISSAVAAFGGLSVLAALVGRPLGSGWSALLLSYGAAALGSVVWIVASYRHTEPGIHNDGLHRNGATSRGLTGWTLGVLFTGFYCLLYWYPVPLEGAIRLTDPLARLLSGKEASRWFLYGLLYTLAVLVMGLRMVYRYRHNRYQIVRTASVAFFQLGFAFLLPAFLRRMNEPEFYFTYFWPLKPEYLYPGKVSSLVDHGGVGLFMVGFGALATFVLTPLLTWRFGKRWYCSWVCGCGGLAETLGDPWRHLSNKSKAAWRFERWSIHSVLVVVVVGTALLWVDQAAGGETLGSLSSGYRKGYGFVVGAVLSGVVGVGFYPLLGSRVWCRFFCPQAAILGIFQRFLSRFRITTNGGQCISCGNCSTYCEMGIDVRAYAQRGDNIVRASCVGCGICAAVCPRGVLKLESGASIGDRFEGSDKPLDALIRSLKS